MSNRSEAIVLMARQIAIFNGLVWDRIDDKARARYMTVAASLIATVERKMPSYNWNERRPHSPDCASNLNLLARCNCDR